MVPDIEIQHLSVCFDTAQGPVYAVNDLSTTFRAGRISGVIGESGSADIITLVDYMIEQGPESGKFTVSELCSRFSPNNSKSMEQRIRRAVNAGLTNLANMGWKTTPTTPSTTWQGHCTALNRFARRWITSAENREPMERYR